MSSTFLYALLASLCYGISPLFEKKGLELTSSTDAVLLRAGFVTAIMIAYSFSKPHGVARYASLDKTAMLLIFCSAVVGVLLAQLFYFKSLESGNISQVVPLVTSMQMIVTVTLAAIFYHEPLSLSRLGGIGCIIVGILLIR